MVVVMLATGSWVTHRIVDGVVHNAGIAAALHLDSVIEPAVQGLAEKGELTPEARAQLARLINVRVGRDSIIGVRIWQGGTVVYSDREEQIGQIFPPSDDRERAWAGAVTVDYNQLSQPEHAPIGAAGLPVLEIYIPINRTGTDDIVALAETYLHVPTLAADIDRAAIGSWIVIGLLTIGMAASQFGIVAAGSHTIDRQRASLDARITELSDLVADNIRLRAQAHQANRRVSEMNERNLRKTAADLHDGPLQLIGLSVLRLDAFTEWLNENHPDLPEDVREDLSIPREALQDCLDELRRISIGLAAPEVESMLPSAMLEFIAQQHERRTGTTVHTDVSDLPDEIPLAVKLCLHRLAQEGLTNAFRHAGGKGQRLRATGHDGVIHVCIEDEGTGMTGTKSLMTKGGQGLSGLRDRVQSVGGQLEIANRDQGGLRLCARFELASFAEEADHV